MARWTLIIALMAALLVACGDDDDGGARGGDTSVADANDDAGPDTEEDAGPGDTGSDDAGEEDTSPPDDTDIGDTPNDTDEGDTAPGDTDDSDTEPSDTDGSDTDGGDTDSTDTEDGDTDSTDTDDGDTESTDTDDGDTESTDTDDGDTDATDTDNGDTDSTDTDNGDTDSTDAGSDISDGGTTGQVPGPGDLVIVEIGGNPSMLLDDDAEYIEVLNVSGRSLDLDGVQLAYLDWSGGEPDNSNATYTISGSFVVEVAQRALLVRSDNTALNGGLVADVTHDNIVFTNGDTRASRIRLLIPSWDGTEPPPATDLIDEVKPPAGTFSNDVRGRAWQLDPGQVANPTTDANDDDANWCLTATSAALEFHTTNYGTPGEPNQCQ